MPWRKSFRTKDNYPTKPSDVAEVVNAAARQNKLGPEAGQYLKTAGAGMVRAHFVGQTAHAVRRHSSRYRKFVGRAQVAAHGLGTGPCDHTPKWLTTVEPLVSNLVVFFLALGITGGLQEYSGAVPSLEIWSSTLGGWQVHALAGAIGLTLVLLGHFAGWLAETARHKETAGRWSRAGGATALIVIAVAAILALGHGRDANLHASGQLIESGQLQAKATTLESRASELERAGGARSQVRVRPTAESRRLRREVERLRRNADALRKDAFQDRTLAFFVFVQFAALALAATGGWAFSVCSPLRLKRRAERFNRKAERAWARAWNRCVVVMSLAQQTMALATIHAGQGGVPYPPVDLDEIERVFIQIMCPPADRARGPVPAIRPFPPTPAPTNGSDPINTN